ALIVEGSAKALRDDPWREYYRLPGWLGGLVEQGALGQKTRAGIYRKEGRDILVFDPARGEYRPSEPRVDEEVQALLAIGDVGERFAALRRSGHPQAHLLWACHRDVFHYAAFLLAGIADTAREVDQAMRWGYGWREGPFETWQRIGWERVNGWLREEIAEGRTMAPAALPDWTGRIAGVHGPRGSYSASADTFKPRSSLPVYARQRMPERLYGEPAPEPGGTLYENDGVRLWEGDDGVAVLSFKSKQHVIGQEVLEGLRESVAIAERDYRAMVIWQARAPFSLGADLKQFLPIMKSGDGGRIDRFLEEFQQAMLAMRYSFVPVVAAVDGMALGGGCELLMHCDRVVA
ncbi:MAG: enoyl-CoA hydratase-related protein, partial [Acidobacteriota bacterium]|nr:enoyl-CoA hydratase-related protein [Acidobacteriota bacterium]